MTTTEVLNDSQQFQFYVHDEQMDLLGQIQEIEKTMGALLESAILISTRREEFLSYVDALRIELWALEAQIDPKYRNVIDTMGTMDVWHEITPQSFVNNDMDIEGPEIYTSTTSYLMTEQLHQSRNTRLEMTGDRTREEQEGEDAPNSYEGSIYDQVVKGAYDLKVYARKEKNGEVKFFENIRILTVRGGGAPFVVEKDFVVEQEWVKYQKAIYAPMGWTRVLERLYIPIKIGHRTIQRRMIWHRSPELKELYYMDNRDAKQEARYRYLLQKYDRLNQVERNKPLYSINGKTKIIGYVTRETINSGGLEFSQSAQLAPKEGYEYSNNPRFNYKQDWAQTLRKAFMQRVDRGNVKECLHVAYNEKAKPTKTVKKQIYATMRVVFSEQPMYVVIFSDVR